MVKTKFVSKTGQVLEDFSFEEPGRDNDPNQTKVVLTYDVF